MTRTQPIVFGTGTRMVGMLTLPDASVRASAGVVVCSPLLHQNITSYRPLRTLAQRIAESGRPVLRFDWPGCGDSADPEVRGLDAWMDAVHDAIAALRVQAGVATVGLVGLRLGAMLATAAAVREPDVSELALLAPVLSGRAYLRELSAFESLSQTATADVAEPGPQLPDGAIEASGFLLVPDEVEALSRLDLTSLDLGSLQVRRALIVSAQPDRKLRALADRLIVAGVEVQCAADDRLSHLLDGTNRSVLPRRVGDLITDWVSIDRDPTHGEPAGTIPTQQPARLVLDKEGIREETVLLATERGARAAVTCEPMTKARADEWVVFLNAARVRRVGPNRLWTTFARSWARSGVHSLRLDVEGVGDSDGIQARDEVAPTDEAQSYEHRLVIDALDAIAWLAENKGGRRFALVGLCSGATWSFQAALEDQRVEALALVNPRLLFWDHRARALKAWAKAVAIGRHPRRWRSVVRRGVRWDAMDALRGATLKITRRGGEEWHQERIISSLRLLNERGTTMCFIFGARDDGIAYFQRHLGEEYGMRLAAAGAQLELIDVDDHTFRPLWSHPVLQKAIERPLVQAGFLTEPVTGDPSRASIATG